MNYISKIRKNEASIPRSLLRGICALHQPPNTHAGMKVGLSASL